MAAPSLADVLRPLAEAGLELDAEAARDAVWLALRMGRHAPAGAQGEAPEARNELDGSAPVDAAGRIDGTSSVRARATVERPASPRAAAAPGLDPGGGTLQGVRLPVAAALPQARGIARGLRPLRRRVAASAGIDLDVEATVRRAAEEDIWLPVLRARRERWLDLTIVVDDSPSMVVWHDVVDELRRVLRWSGAFRGIDTWWARAGDETALHAGPAGTSRGERSHPPSRIAPVARRGLVLVVTDCVADAWYDGRLVGMLAGWSRAAPVAIVQVLPQRLWGRTGLGYGMPVRLRAPARAATNPHLVGTGVPAWAPVEGDAEPFLAPVATLDAASILQIARMVGGPSPEPTAGFAFDLAAMRDAGPPPAPRAMPPSERVRRFWSVASSPARRLASAFAASPFLDLRVLRLLRRELIPDGTHLHEAEVVLGGLLRRTNDGDPVAFTFTEGVRPLLLDNVATDDALRVLRRAAELAADEHPDARQFIAALADPAAMTSPLSREEGSFASRVAGFLEWLGGPYARIVVQDEAAPGVAPSSEAAGEPTPFAPAYGHLDPAEGPPFIDREPMLRALADWWSDRAAARVLAIHGERGSGRSSLARAFLAQLQQTGLPDGLFVANASAATPGEALLEAVAGYFTVEDADRSQAHDSVEARLAATLAGLRGRHLVVLDDFDALDASQTRGWIEALQAALADAGADVRLLVVVGPAFERPSDWAGVATSPFKADAGITLLRYLGVEADDSLLHRLALLGRGLPERLVRIAALWKRDGDIATRLEAAARGEALPEDVDAFLDALESPPEDAAEARFTAILAGMEHAEPERALDLAMAGVEEADRDRRFDRSAILLSLRAALLHRLDRREEARNDLAGAAARARDMREPERRVPALLAVGRAATEMRDLNEARYVLEDAFETEQRVSNWAGAATALELVARVHVLDGQPRDAMERLRTSADLRQRTGDTIGRANALLRGAMVALAEEALARSAVPFVDEACRTLSAAGVAVDPEALQRALGVLAHRGPESAVPMLSIFGHGRDAEWSQHMGGAIGVYANIGAVRLSDLTDRADDESVEPGVEARLAESDTVVLLVSDALLHDERYRAIAERLARARPVLVVPVLVEYAKWQAHDWLEVLQILPSADRPLAAAKPPERTRMIAEVAARCVTIAAGMRDRRDAPMA